MTTISKRMVRVKNTSAVLPEIVIHGAAYGSQDAGMFSDSLQGTSASSFEHGVVSNPGDAVPADRPDELSSSEQIAHTVWLRSQ